MVSPKDVTPQAMVPSREASGTLTQKCGVCGRGDVSTELFSYCWRDGKRLLGWVCWDCELLWHRQLALLYVVVERVVGSQDGFV